MADILFAAVLVAGLSWVAWRAFQTPEGVYVRAVVGFAIAVAAAAGLWTLGGPFIANEAGFGALVVFLIVVAIAAVFAVVACIGASARYLRDALVRRNS